MVEDYPRANLSFVCTRRNFFRALLQEIVVTIKTAQGGQSMKLSDLGSMSDNRLAQIVPTINPDYQIYVGDGYLYISDKQTGKTYRRLPLTEENGQILAYFNGQNTLGTIASQISRDLDWEECKAFAHIRGLFLLLANHLICFPGNPIQNDDDK